MPRGGSKAPRDESLEEKGVALFTEDFEYEDAVTQEQKGDVQAQSEEWTEERLHIAAAQFARAGYIQIAFVSNAVSFVNRPSS